jgi:hypothetical protein
VLDDFLAEVACAEDETLESRLPEQADLMGKKGLARDFDEQLRDFLGHGPKPGGKPPRKNGDGQIG